MKKISIIVICLSIFQLYSVDMDFGVFQYKGSQLKKITMYVMKWGKPKKFQGADYIYDDNGHLIGRKVYGYLEHKYPFNHYETSIAYYLESNQIIEYVNRNTPFEKAMPIIFEYNYDTKRRLVNHKRFDSNLKNNKIKLSRDVNIEYNDKNDIVAIYDKKEISADSVYFPGDGLLDDSKLKQEFKFEYQDNLKIKYFKYSKIDIYDTEYYFDNNIIVKLISYFNKNKNEIGYINYFKYDTNGNIIGNLFDNNILKNKQKITYEYDDQNRLTKRIIHFYKENNEEQDKVQYIEEYEYEDGPYIHFPYLLPTTKIRVYQNSNSEYSVDRDVF